MTFAWNITDHFRKGLSEVDKTKKTRAECNIPVGPLVIGVVCVDPRVDEDGDEKVDGALREILAGFRRAGSKSGKFNTFGRNGSIRRKMREE